MNYFIDNIKTYSNVNKKERRYHGNINRITMG